MRKHLIAALIAVVGLVGACVSSHHHYRPRTPRADMYSAQVRPGAQDMYSSPQDMYSSPQDMYSSPQDMY